MEQLKFTIKTLLHPFNSFSDMKLEKKGRIFTALLLMVLTYLSNIFSIQARAFLFNNQYNTPVDLIHQFRILAIPILLFVLANWSITTLIDGKGNIKDIFMVVGYSMMPLIIFNILTAIISNFISLNDGVYLTALDYTGIIWFLILVYIGIQTVHDFEYGKTVGSFLLTFVSMFVIVFICFLFFSLIQEITGFIYSIYLEITLRF